jgi:hypothetical protein
VDVVQQGLARNSVTSLRRPYCEDLAAATGRRRTSRDPQASESFIDFGLAALSFFDIALPTPARVQFN